MVENKIGIAIIGLDHWYWALGCAYNISSNAQTELRWICHSDGREARKISEIYGATNYTTDYHDVLEDSGVKAVVITSTTDMHAHLACESARAGKDILIGKPMARTLAEADRILYETKKHKVKLFPMASGPLPDDYVLKLINEGRIGVPYSAHCSMLAIAPFRAPGVTDPGWFVDMNKSPGGAFMDHGVYDVALLRKYFNSEVESVYAEMGKFRHPDYEVEDYGVALLRFRNGAVATVESSYSAITQSHSRKIIVGCDGEIEIRRNMLSDGSSMISVWGKKERDGQKVMIETMPPEPVFLRNYVEKAIPIPPRALAYRPTLDEFVNSIIEHREPCSSGDDARVVLEVCLAAYKSVETGQITELPLDSDVDVRKVLVSLSPFRGARAEKIPTELETP